MRQDSPGNNPGQSGEPDRARASWLEPLAFCATLASIAAMAFCESSDGDLGFHLATGREVLAHARIPATNVLSFSNPDYPWLLHQWLPATLFALLFDHGGFTAVLTFKLVLVVAAFAIAFASARALGASALVTAFCCMLAAAACAFRFEPRPLLFSELLLSAVIWSYARYTRAAARALPTRGALLAAGTLAFACCHLHAGALFLFFALAAIALGCLIEPFRARILSCPALPPYGMRHALAWALTALVAALLAALLLSLYHPFGARVLLFPFDMASDAYLTLHLIEFRPPYRFPASYLLAFWCLFCATLAVIVSCARSMHAASLLLLCGFGALVLRHTRFVFEFALVAAPLIAAALSQSPLRVRVQFGPRFSSVLLLAAATLAPLDNWHKLAPGFGLAPRTWPLAHFACMRTLDLHGHVFASDAWAGPMLGLFYPRQRAFFDNRFEAYPRSFFRDSYQATRYGKPGWDTVLDRYAIEIVLLRYTSEGERRFQGGADNLRQKLASDARYALVFFDDYGELFVRSRGVNQKQAEARGIAGVDPDRGRFIARPRASAEGLRRALSFGPRSTRLLTLTAAALSDAGDRETARKLLSEAESKATGALAVP